MNSREKILVVGAGIFQCKAIIHLRRLGFSVFSIDGSNIAPGFQYSKDFMVCDITDHLKIIEAATKFKVNGITSYGTDVPIVAIANAAEKSNSGVLNKRFLLYCPEASVYIYL